ncbi:MAG TPA: hypothetical protein VI260_27905 [Blastocatellia bacterium]|jgi:hypothetical protein
MDTSNYDREEGRKIYLSSCNLYTIVDGRKYLIDWLIRGLVAIPEPILDSANNHVAYASNIGCGAPHDEGMVVFISDVYGKKKRPIIGNCQYLRPVKFLDYMGRTYLLISETSDADFTSFWLYDVNGGEFVLHADGDVKGLKNGTYAYGSYDYDPDYKFKRIGIVTMSDLVGREAPLKLLSRYPTHGLTQGRNVQVYGSDGCWLPGTTNAPPRTIRRSREKVLILNECSEGDYVVYWQGQRGKIMKGGLRPIKW